VKPPWIRFKTGTLSSKTRFKVWTMYQILMKLLPALARSSKQRRINGKVLHVSFLCSDKLGLCSYELMMNGSLRSSWPRREMPSSAARRSGEAVGGSEARRPTNGSPRSRAEEKSEVDPRRG
jgi:hypothetical protein